MTPPMEESRKRRRPPVSCVQCRQRKIKCDRRLPCGQCVRARAGYSCSFPPGAAPFQHPDGDHVSHLNVISGSSMFLDQSSRERPPGQENHESNRRDLVSRPEGLGAGSRAEVGPPADDTVESLKNRVQALEQLIANSVHTPTELDGTHERSVHILEAPTRRTEHQDTGDFSSRSYPRGEHNLIIPVAPTNLRLSRDKTKFYGSTHWKHAFEQSHVIARFKTRAIRPSQNDPGTVEVMALIDNCRLLRKSIKSQESVPCLNPFPGLYGTIPTRDTCDQLVRAYLRTFELVYRILHLPTFWKQYNQYWESPQTAPPSFTMKLLLVLAIGSTFYQNEDFARVQASAVQWVYAAQWWLAGPTERYTLNMDGMQVQCLLLIAKQASSQGIGTIWISSGSLLRFAFSLGLHRNPTQFSVLSLFQCEMRRRLWATVLEMVVQFSFDASMPSLLSFDDFDCDAPANIDDDEIDENTKIQPSSKPASTLTQMSIQTLLLKSIRKRYEVVHLINDFRNDQSYEGVLKLGSELTSASREITRFFLTHSGHNSEHGPTDFHRKLLEVLMQRSILSLHQPFVLEARKDLRFHFSRKISLEASMIILSSIGKLNAPIGSIEDFSRLTICGSGIFKGAISIDAIIFVCLELIYQLEEEASNTLGVENALAAPNILAQLGRAARVPLFETLDTVLEQLLHLIAIGQASLKRYIFMSAALAQAKAMEAGEAPDDAMREATKRSLETCHELMTAYLRNSDKPGIDLNFEDGAQSLEHGIGFDSELDSLIQGAEMSPDMSDWLLAMWDDNFNSFSVPDSV